MILKDKITEILKHEYNQDLGDAHKVTFSDKYHASVALEILDEILYMIKKGEIGK